MQEGDGMSKSLKEAVEELERNAAEIEMAAHKNLKMIAQLRKIMNEEAIRDERNKKEHEY